MFLPFGRELEPSGTCMNERFRPGYSRSHWNTRWCGGKNCGTKRRHCNYIQRIDRLWKITAVPVTTSHMQCVKGVGRQHTTYTTCQNAACSSKFFLQRVDYNWAILHYFCRLFHTERSWHAYCVFLVGMIFPLMRVESVFFNLFWNVNFLVTAKKKLLSFLDLND